MRDRKACIVSILKEMDNDVLLRFWNEYCNECNMDDYVYDNDEYTLNDMFQSVDEALRAACYGNYNYQDEYFVINAYGNLDSFTEYGISEHVDFDSLADYIMDNGCYEISEVWYDDVEGDFVDYFNNKFEDVEISVEDIPYGSDLVTEDWDKVSEEILENLKGEDQEEEDNE